MGAMSGTLATIFGFDAGKKWITREGRTGISRTGSGAPRASGRKKSFGLRMDRNVRVLGRGSPTERPPRLFRGLGVISPPNPHRDGRGGCQTDRTAPVEIAERVRESVIPRRTITSRWLRRYRSLVTSANTGAVLRELEPDYLPDGCPDVTATGSIPTRTPVPV